MQRVYTSPDATIVHHAKNVLANQGIEGIVRGEHLASAAGGVAPIDAWIELWILDEDRLVEAREILEQALTETKVTGEPWHCPNCEERIEAQFTECWKCSTARPAKDR